jgi:hypothetical protein
MRRKKDRDHGFLEQEVSLKILLSPEERSDCHICRTRPPLWQHFVRKRVAKREFDSRICAPEFCEDWRQVTAKNDGQRNDYTTALLCH